MSRNQQWSPVSGTMVLILFMLNGIVIEMAYVVNTDLYWLLLISMPLLFLAIYKMQSH